MNTGFQFDNADSRILTILVIGTEEKVRDYIFSQRHFAEVGSWSLLIPVPNCPSKVMSILNKLTA